MHAVAAQQVCAVFSTESVPPPDRLSFWRDTVLRRMEPTVQLSETRPFRARMVRFSSEHGDMLEHSADPVVVVRTAQQCRHDGCDDISFGFVLDGISIHTEKGNQPIRAGDANIIDCARPLDMRLSRHRTMSLVLRRARVQDALGIDPALLPELRLPRVGMTAILRGHMQETLRQALHLSPEERTVAFDTAAELAMAAIRGALARPLEGERFPRALHQAALALIARECTDPELTPIRVAAALGCSRAALYRLFAGAETSVSAHIWTARLEHAYGMLLSDLHAATAIGEIAFRSGFVDHPTFNRMFRRRYAMSPRDVRSRQECSFLKERSKEFS
jgi:AraC family transcriptional activator of tynA and feaB